ncbi:FAD-dependent oxidoreductase (plasmid) [Deinococcus radiomollis]|uniref:NAD(P)/FAD-dependent oxidoreductase n=1 Tax=Deinococcus radiomollis TaxID=468916 RepID=UPI003891EF7A
MIAVVGGGLIGACVAFELHDAGQDVVVFDAALPGAAWKASAGLLTPSNERLAGTPLEADARESLQLWPAFAARLERAAGDSVHYREVADDTTEFQRGEGQVHPPSVRRAALAHVSVCPTRVRRVYTYGSRLGLRTDDGTVHAEAVIMACGAWSADFGLPVWASQGQALLLRGAAEHSPRYARARRGFSLYALGRPDGMYVGATSRASNDTLGDPWAARWLTLAASQLLGDDVAERVEAQLVGLRPVTADGRPIVGPHPHLAGVFVATGHGRHGALLAPLTAARCLAWVEQRVSCEREIHPQRRV